MRNPEKITGISQKTAVFLALFIGLMSVFAGSRVLLGMDVKEYPILNWLVWYNVIMGLVSVIAAFVMWKNDYRAANFITFIFFTHLVVEIIIRFFSDTAAAESKKAMLFRIFIWLIISVLYIHIPKAYLRKKNN